MQTLQDFGMIFAQCGRLGQEGFNPTTERRIGDVHGFRERLFLALLRLLGGLRNLALALRPLLFCSFFSLGGTTRLIAFESKLGDISGSEQWKNG